MPTPEDVVNECLNYIETVIVFSFLHKKLVDSEIIHHIERDMILPPPKQKGTPDITIYKESVTDIIEHKASLPNFEDFALKEINECFDKYQKVIFNDCECIPNVILLYPKKKQYMIEKIKEDIPKGLQLCFFDLSDKEIFFQKDAKVNHQDLGHLLKLSPYPCMRHHFSKHKFIKAEPPVVYTAFEVTQILRTFLDVKTITQDQFLVNRADVLSHMNSFYPPWVSENLKQISSKRLNNALEFLDKIDMVDWEKNTGEITVYRGKGKRSGDIFKTYAEKWCKIKEKDEKKKIRNKIKPGKETIQKSLYE